VSESARGASFRSVGIAWSRTTSSCPPFVKRGSGYGPPGCGRPTPGPGSGRPAATATPFDRAQALPSAEQSHPRLIALVELAKILQPSHHIRPAASSAHIDLLVLALGPVESQVPEGCTAKRAVILGGPDLLSALRARLEARPGLAWVGPVAGCGVAQSVIAQRRVRLINHRYHQPATSRSLSQPPASVAIPASTPPRQGELSSSAPAR